MIETTITDKQFFRVRELSALTGLSKPKIFQALNEGKLKVIVDFEISEPKTKAAAGALERIGAQGKTLLVSDWEKSNFLTALKNIRKAKPLRVEGLNVYDIMWHENLLCTKGALEAIAQRIKG